MDEPRPLTASRGRAEQPATGTALPLAGVRPPVSGRGRDPRTVCVGLTETSRLIRAAAQRRSASLLRQHAVVQERLAAREVLPPGTSGQPAVPARRTGPVPGRG